jgi:serine/threonine protein phosphatase PrpC
VTVDPAGGWVGYGLSEIGRIRTSNQDAFAVCDAARLWVVADGMGGHAGGDVASRIAVQSVTVTMQERVGLSPNQVSAADSISAVFRQAVQASNRAILLEAAKQPDLTGMGTTLVILHLTTTPRPLATIANVGDSRVYRLRAQQLTQLTVDHSLIEDYRRRGLVSEAEVNTHPLRHVLSRAVGIDPEVDPDLTTFVVEPDDVFLLCTDGLTKMLDDRRIRDLLLRAGDSREQMSRCLVHEANRLGGEDNITVVIVSRSRR